MRLEAQNQRQLVEEVEEAVMHPRKEQEEVDLLDEAQEQLQALELEESDEQRDFSQPIPKTQLKTGDNSRKK